MTALFTKADVFSFSKENGVVSYSHQMADPFGHKEEDIIGGYCIIKNKRGEFITTLSRDEINKARRVAKTQTILAIVVCRDVQKDDHQKSCQIPF